MGSEFEDQGSLLKNWLKRKSDSGSPSDQIAPCPQGEPVPLSYRQERIWFLQQMYPSNPFYHLAESLEFKGDFNQYYFRKSLELLINRHNILRTSFQSDGINVVQINDDQIKYDFTSHDVSELSDEERLKSLNEIIYQETHKQFDLEQGPLFRVCLIKHGAVYHQVIFTIHHIITDMWSIGMMKEELSKSYNQLSQQSPTVIDVLPIQYADYAYWQRNREIAVKDVEYWKEKLKGDLTQLKLPFAFDRPTSPTFRGSMCSRVVPSATHEAISAICAQMNTTHYTFFLAVYKVFLSRLCNEEDIIVGSPFTDRNSTQLEKLMGFFDDTLIVRSDLSGNPTFIDVLQSVKATVLECLEHRNMPFDHLVRSLNPKRLLNMNPLFQVMFIFFEEQPTPSFGSNLSMASRNLDIGVSKFDLALNVGVTDGVINTTFEYSKDLFDLEAIEKMQGYFQSLLNAIIQNPHSRISELEILSTSEKQSLIGEWGQNLVELPQAKSIVQLFELAATDFAGHPAVADHHKVISYEQLNQMSDAVASKLTESKTAGKSYVGLYTDVSIEMIAGILGILKAGCGYLPLDIEAPLDRISHLLDDSGAQYILTQSELADNLGDLDVSVVSIENIIEGKSEVIVKSAKELTGKDPAYLIYTSGSTGTPKGVPINHSNLLNSTLARSAYYEESPGSFLLLSSYTFDSSVAGIFWTLTTGGKLVLPKRRSEQDLQLMAGLITEHEVTHMLLLPSLYETFLQHIPVDKLQSLQTVILAGESCSTKLIERHFLTLPDARIHNEYGPTESTVWATVYEFTPDDIGKRIPIGKPVPNVSVYVLDKHLNPVPPGVEGELYLGGHNLSEGYINDQIFTLQKFIENPFDHTGGKLIYKTGDRVSFRPDGNLDFYGRNDDQLKLRGYRIELNEIREAMNGFEGIDEIEVVTQNDRSTLPDGDYNLDVLADDIELIAQNVDESMVKYIEDLSDTDAMQLLSRVETKTS